MSYKDVSADDVLTFTKPTDAFLCPLSANKHAIEFLEFTIIDYNSKNVIFNVGRDNPPPMELDLDFATLDENAYRSIKYDFSEDVLRLPAIQTTLVFSVGEKEVPNFRMIERHYFREELVKSYDFRFGFCIPNSTNTWDAIYSVPPLDDDLVNDMIDHPHETKSDSFYFVDNQLVMHNKASYRYIREDAAQAKKSYEERYGSKGSKRRAAPSGGAGSAGGSSSKYGDYDSDDGRDDEDGGVVGSTRRAGGAAEAKAERKSEGKYGDDDDDDPGAGWSKDEDYY